MKSRRYIIFFLLATPIIGIPVTKAMCASEPGPPCIKAKTTYGSVGTLKVMHTGERMLVQSGRQEPRGMIDVVCEPTPLDFSMRRFGGTAVSFDGNHVVAEHEGTAFVEFRIEQATFVDYIVVANEYLPKRLDWDSLRLACGEPCRRAGWPSPPVLPDTVAR